MAEATRGMIEEIVTEDTVAQSVLIAVNALYFKGKWSVRFDVADTEVAPFQPVGGAPSTCHMMQTPVGKKWCYHEDANAQYIMLPYLHSHVPPGLS